MGNRELLGRAVCGMGSGFLGLVLGLVWSEGHGAVLAAREAELRRLRKMNTEFEEQNAILQKHTESMNCAKEKLEQELAQEERQTLALQQQLQSVRQALTASFASLPIPGELGAAVGPPGCWDPCLGREALRGHPIPCRGALWGSEVVVSAHLLLGWHPAALGEFSRKSRDGFPVLGQGRLGSLLLWSHTHSCTPDWPKSMCVLGMWHCRRWHLVLRFLLQSPVHGQGWVGIYWPCSLGCHLTGTGETPTLSTLDFYMAKLHSAIESNPVQHEPLVLRVKEILSRIAR